MLMPELNYETDQKISEHADGGGRGTFTPRGTPFNRSAHVVVASGILRMRQAVSSMRTSPVRLIPSSSPWLQILACVLYQELLRTLGEGKNSNIFHSNELLVEVIKLISAVHSVEIMDVQRAGSG